MNLMKSLRNAVAAVMLLSAGVANAGLYQFELTGDYTATWQVDSSPAPDVVGDGEGFILWDVVGVFPGSLFDIADLTFYNTAIGGGFEIYDWWNDTYLLVTDGLQLYSGPESAPTFNLGTFALSEYMGTGSYTLTITDLEAGEVPEPATGAMLLGGLAAMAALRKRRQKLA